MSLLKHIGHVLLAIVTFGAIAGKDAAPFLALFAPAWASLVNATSTAVLTAQAAGTSALASAPAGDTNAQKLAIVIAAIKPQALAFATTIGASDPTDAQIETYVNGIVAALGAFQVPAATPAA
jgi:hypothetical protein